MEAQKVIRLWRAAEMFSPRPLPACAVGVAAGEPLPWERPGRDGWRHEVFGGVFAMAGSAGFSGESALFTCTVSASGELLAGPDVSECAWAAGQLALGDDAGASGDPSSWLTASSAAGRLPVARENLPGLGGGPLDLAALERFTAELAELLGVTDLLRPSGFRVHSHAGAEGGGAPLSGYFAADLARLAASDPGPALRAFLEHKPARPEASRERIDVRADPLTVRDGCSPGRMPAGRWPADEPLVLSEQFAVNEIMATDAPLTAVDAPDDAAPVFNDLIAAIVTERGRVLAGLPSPSAAFGPPVAWGPHSVSPPAAALTGFEILLAFPGDDGPPGLGTVGAGWRERADGYFASTARLAGGDPWALIRAHLGGPAECRAFTDRFWHGRVHGSEALFSAGEPMRSALRAPGGPAGGWPASAAGFRSSLNEIEFLSSERIFAADTLARLSSVEDECEAAYSRLEEAEALVAALSPGEPAAREAVAAAEERRRACLEDLRAHQSDRPGLAVTVSTGLRASREWYAEHAKLRSALSDAMRARDAAMEAARDLRSRLADGRRTAEESRETADRCATAMEALQAPAAAARKRWGDHVPEGPSYAETEDAALIERRENSAPWSDPEFAAARAKLFLSALALHESLIRANADVIEANLAAWADMVSGDGPSGDEGAGPPPAEIALAAWQTFFLVVPTVSVSLGSAASLLAGLGPGSVGWLLAAGCGGVPPRHLAGALWRANRAVLAGSGPGSLGSGPGEEECALTRAARVTRFGTRLPDGTWTGLPLYQRRGAPAPDRPVSDTEMLRAVLSDLRQRARSRRGTRTPSP